MNYSKTYRDRDANISYFHCICHTVYRTEEGDHYALTTDDKNMLIRLLKRLEELYADGVEVLQYTLLDNHMHLVLAEYKDFEIDCKEMKRRYSKPQVLG